jgi:cell division protein FtsI/penicillin-binding protein 2
LEYHFEADLRGEHGWVETERDARASEKRVVRERLPRPGATLQLTISKADQDRGSHVLGDVEAAFAVVNADTGAVLVLVSTPSFDPNRTGEAAAEWKRREETFGVTGSPFFPSAYRGTHQPGSILKPFTAVAALAAGDVDLEEQIRCERIFHHKGRPLLDVLRCNAYHEESNLHRAIVRSCNIYFQTLMDRMLEREHFPLFEETGRSFGFGRQTGIEIEPEGRLAEGWDFHRTRQWAQFVASAIGQGPVALSPAQVARAYAGLATGRLPRLHLVARVGDRLTAPRYESLGIRDALLEPVRNALREVPRTGTGRGYGLEPWSIACKTGTAQVSVERSLNNAWMAGFAPAQRGRPSIAFAMVVLRTPFGGGHECGPRLAEYFRYFYSEKAQ